MKEDINSFKVTDRKSFVEFLELLKKDFVENNESWENKSIPDLLEVLSMYAEDIQGYYDNTKQNKNADQADWSTFADIFKGAKIYE
ncbi:DUF7660 family protein [Sphingobacterium sp. MYb388]|uniref:DUF7660 family protein n=1 Tax=Sphingobacterium sp. MYb388 TaxID=2745437 RepID=UPI0030A32671